MHLVPPMTMLDFFRKSEGIWFSERTVHHFDAVADESGDSNLMIRVLESGDPRIQEVCETQKVKVSDVAGAASFSWLANLDDLEPNPNYAAILVDVPDPDNPSRGKFLRNRGYVEGIPVVCRYHFAPDGVLTIETEYERNQGQERCWFVTDDFRVRVSTVRMMNGVNLMTYCSERRCMMTETLEEMAQNHIDRPRQEVKKFTI
ncbi:phycobiliprotein lyase [Oscillatoriales cyanobacterium LEGE 11467]|uniref:Chromophore lyase CpcS/CpeS n=1 Tax=Zarconia navalis LEGE 11467 TaxID=1828826 RepID=A0A928VXD2_9CYAN|nr:phycobiliprotein lyase [Zarconia navalis]MBE9039530.1 phycobiliprotein lyase [Zarconia navalis LEGE 11467]